MNISTPKPMARIGAVLITAALGAGCEVGVHVSSKPAVPQNVQTPKEFCIKGVVYYRMGHGLAAAFTPDSKVITCSEPDR